MSFLAVGVRVGEGIYIGRDMRVMVAEIRRDGTIRLAIQAPDHVAISRTAFSYESHLKYQDKRERAGDPSHGDGNG